MASKTTLDTPPTPSWVVALNSPLPPKSKDASKIPDPPGFPSGGSGSQGAGKRPTQQSKPVETDTLKLKKAWEIALAPAKQLPMQAIMMYMSGNGLQIFSIMMVFMLFKGPIQGLLSTNATFVKFDAESIRGKLIVVKAVYVLMQLVLFGLGVWKVNAMGLLPTTRSDWLAWESERQPLERAYFAFG